MDFLKQVLATITGVLLTGIILFVAFIIFIGALIQQSSKESAVPAPAKSVLYISMDFDVMEKTESNPLGDLNLPLYGGRKSIGLNDIIAKIKAAKNDSNIKGIYLNPSATGVGFATLKAIRDAIVDFKESDKFVIAYSDAYSQKAYYLASAADSIYLNPQGSLDFRGLSSSVVFMKEALDKLGVDMQVIKVGTYKSAVEPFLLNEMSAPNREQVTSYLNSIYSSFLTDISSGRNIEKDSLERIADEYLIRNPKDALHYKFIDGELYKDELLAVIKKKIDVAADKDISSVSILNYGGKPDVSTTNNEVAVLYAYGDIVDGEGAIGEIGGDKISRELRKLRMDDNVKAVVLRINSGGGSALASDIIWREVELTKSVKPIVVSMGDYAASGGYYIAAAADSIFAEANTLTGSIGVFGLIPNFKGLLNNKLGIHIQNVNTGKYSSLMGDPDNALTAEETSIIQLQVNEVYATFMDRVAKGRNMTIAQVDSIGQGRVWSGAQALELGLVDRIGDLQTAINAATSKGKIDTYKVVEYPVKEDAFSQLLSTSKDKIKLWFFKEELGDYQKYLLDVKKNLTQTGIQARLPYAIEIY